MKKVTLLIPDTFKIGNEDKFPPNPNVEVSHDIIITDSDFDGKIILDKEHLRLMGDYDYYLGDTPSGEEKRLISLCYSYEKEPEEEKKIDWSKKMSEVKEEEFLQMCGAVDSLKKQCIDLVEDILTGNGVTAIKKYLIQAIKNDNFDYASLFVKDTFKSLTQLKKELEEIARIIYSLQNTIKKNEEVKKKEEK